MPIARNSAINAWTRRYIKEQIETLDDDVQTPLIPKVTPVNAVAAAKVLTVAGTPAEGNTVSMGGVTYKFRAAIGEGAYATGTLTTTDVPHEGDTVTIDGRTYTITATVNAANKVLLEASASATLDNLVSAINGTAGAGTKYGTGTAIHATFSAAKGTTATMVVTSKTIGFAGNGKATTQVATHATWGAETTAGGVDPQAANDVLIGDNAESAIDNLVLAVLCADAEDEGVKYGTGTVVNPLVSAVKATAATMTCTNLIKGVIGNSTAIAKSGTNLSWALSATKLTGGVDGTIGAEGAIKFDTGYVWVCTADNTIHDANWKKAQLA